jgi:sugar phosphate isomerase/epimerase
MQIGVSSLHLMGKQFDSLLGAIRDCDVGVWEIVDDDTLALTKENTGDLVDLRRSLGIEYTVHSPIADINISAVNEDFRRMTIDRLKKSLQHAGMIGARLWIFHPGIYSGLGLFYPDKDMENCVKSVNELFEFAQRIGIRIGIENMPDLVMFLLRGTDDFSRFYELAGNKAPELVLDIGHANTTNEIERFFERQGKRIAHLHAHDNDGRTDSHDRIGYGTVPWKAVASRLSRLEFEGTVMIESVRDISESIKAARQLFL